MAPGERFDIMEGVLRAHGVTLLLVLLAWFVLHLVGCASPTAALPVPTVLVVNPTPDTVVVTESNAVPHGSALAFQPTQYAPPFATTCVAFAGPSNGAAIIWAITKSDLIASTGTFEISGSFNWRLDVGVTPFVTTLLSENTPCHA